MIDGNSVLSVTPARGGSKGVHKKNLRHVAGMSLTARTAQLASSISWIDKAVLSTDNKEIRDEGVKFGLEAPFLRPEKLSGDRVAAIDVWRHAWLECEKNENKIFDVGIYIEPTCPLRREEHIKSTVKELISGNWDAVWTVSKIDPRHHPYKKLRIEKNNAIELYDDRGANIIARQQLEDLHERNGVCYAAKRSTVIEKNGR